MEKLNINTGLERFLLLDRITEVNEMIIQGVSIPIKEKAFFLIESMAQLGAIHIRYCSSFNCHAFLSAVRNFHLPDEFTCRERFNLTGELKSRSKTGFLYALKAEADRGDLVSGDFLFAAIPYDDMFRKSFLKSHYEKVFSCLQSVSQGE